jgi:hypothetical protein
MTRWLLQLSTGEYVTTVHANTQPQMAYTVAKGGAIEVETNAIFKADRQRWTLNSAHVVMYKPSNKKVEEEE